MRKIVIFIGLIMVLMTSCVSTGRIVWVEPTQKGQGCPPRKNMLIESSKTKLIYAVNCNSQVVSNPKDITIKEKQTVKFKGGCKTTGQQPEKYKKGKVTKVTTK